MPVIHDFDPVALQIGPLAIRWYGLMYLVGFLLFLLLGELRSREKWRGMSSTDVDDLLFYGMIGVIVGGRLGHVIFYGPLSYYLANPFEIIAVWKGGMASHGGIIGVILAMWWFASRRDKKFLTVAEVAAAITQLARTTVAISPARRASSSARTAAVRASSGRRATR